MSKKWKNHKMKFRCPNCGEWIETRNMYPKCHQCDTSLKVIEKNPEVKVVVRNKKGQ